MIFKRTTVNIIAGPSASVEEALVFIARVCTNTVPEKVSEEDKRKLIRKLIERDHMGIFEHAIVSFWITCTRSCSHQLVRHRLHSFAQESQRYVRYEKGIPIIVPDDIDDITPEQMAAYEQAEKSYMEMIERGKTPDEARSVLPNQTATALVMTGNLRTWLHFLELRLASGASSEIRGIAEAIEKQLQDLFPNVMRFWREKYDSRN